MSLTIKLSVSGRSRASWTSTSSSPWRKWPFKVHKGSKNTNNSHPNIFTNVLFSYFLLYSNGCIKISSKCNVEKACFDGIPEVWKQFSKIKCFKNWKINHKFQIAVTFENSAFVSRKKNSLWTFDGAPHPSCQLFDWFSCLCLFWKCFFEPSCKRMVFRRNSASNLLFFLAFHQDIISSTTRPKPRPERQRSKKV